MKVLDRDSMQEMMQFYMSENYNAWYYTGQKRQGRHEMRIRRKDVGTVNGKQIMTFGNGLGLSKLALERWAGRVLHRLDQGATEEETNLWIHAKMSEFRF